MPLVAKLADTKQRIDLTLVDDSEWETIRKERPPFICTCGAPMHTVARPVMRPDGNFEVRYFQHNPGHGHCYDMEREGESVEHVAMKATLARSVRSAKGWTAQLECVLGDDCRTDVLAIGPKGEHWALEAQISRQQTHKAIERSETYTRHVSDITWTTVGKPEWSFHVPALGVDAADHQMVVHGIEVHLPMQEPMVAPPRPLETVIPRIIQGNHIHYLPDERYYRDVLLDQEARQRMNLSTKAKERPTKEYESRAKYECDRPSTLDVGGDTGPTVTLPPAEFQRDGLQVYLRCPRCQHFFPQEIYGPCERCRNELRSKFRKAG